MSSPTISVVGRTLVDVLASARPTLGEAILGLGRPSYYSVVLLLDFGERVVLSGGDLEPWVEDEALVPVTAATFELDPTMDFRNQTIVAVKHDEEGDLVVVLTNQTELSVHVSFGTRIDLVRSNSK